MTGPKGLHVPYRPNGPSLIPANTPTQRHQPGRPAPLLLAQLRPVHRNGLPAGRDSRVHSIFAQDTIANSNYNSLQASLDKRFAHGLQFTAGLHLQQIVRRGLELRGHPESDSIRSRSRALSEFDARHRIVFSYYWELPFHKYTGATGKVLNGWALSGITTYQTGFPIRIHFVGRQ